MKQFLNKISRKAKIIAANFSKRKLADEFCSNYAEKFLSNIIIASSSSTDIKYVIKTIVTKTGKFFKANRCMFVEYDSATGEVSPIKDYAVYLSSKNIKNVVGLKVSKEQLAPFADIPFNKKQVLAIDNLDIYEIPELSRALLRNYGVKSLLIAPIIYENNPLGLLIIAYVKYYKKFSLQEINFLSAVAKQFTVIIHQSQLFQQTMEAKNREILLRKVIDAIRTTLDINELKKIIVTEIGKLFNSDICFIREYDEKQNKFKGVDTNSEYLSSPFEKNPIEKDPEDLGFKMVKRVFKLPDLTIIPDTQNISKYSDPENLELMKYFKEFNIKSNYGFPMYYTDQFMGKLVLIYTKSEVEISKEDINFIKTLADQAASALYQSKLYIKEKQTAERESLLREVINAIRTTLDINELKNKIVNEIGKVLNADRCAIMQYDQVNHKFLEIDEYSQYVTSEEMGSHIGINLEHERFSAFKELYLNQRKELIIEDIDNPPENLDPQIIEVLKKYKIKSTYTVLITYGDQFLGFLYVNYIKNKRKFSGDELDFFRTLANQAGIAIKQAELYEIQKQTAEREGLLRQIILSSISSMDFKNVINTIVTETGNFFKADRCYFIRYDNKNERLDVPIESYQEYLAFPDIKKMEKRKFTREETASYEKSIIKQRQIAIAEDTNKVYMPEVTRQMIIDEYKIKSFLAAPVYYKNIPIGIINLNFTRNYKKFTQDEIDLFVAVANQSAIVIHQSKLFNEIQEAKNRETILKTITNEILISNSLQDAVQRITRKIGELFGFDRIAFRLFDSVTRSFTGVVGEYRASENIPSAIETDIDTSQANEYLSKIIFDNREILFVDNVETTGLPEIVRTTLKNLSVKSTVALPIINNDMPMGVLFLTNTQSYKTLQQNEIEFLYPISQQIALAINLFDLNFKLTKALSNEENLRKILISIRNIKDHDELFRYLLSQLLDIFNVHIGLHLHYDKPGDIKAEIEVIKDENRGVESLKNKIIFSRDNFKKLLSTISNDIIVVDNVKEIENAELREDLEKISISSFLLYPVSAEKEKQALGSVMIISLVLRKWTSEEINYFRLILDTTALVYQEITQRKEAEELKETFLATLTHDLRSPINAEQKALEVIISKKLGTSLDDFAEYLQDIYKTNEELLRIVNNILSVYHYESGQVELKLEPADIKDIINDSVKSLIHLAEDQGSEIVTDIQSDLPLLNIDRDEIFRVITNLISNAIKHNKKGTSITISANRVDNEIQVSIQDNGKGIPESERHNIFQRYPTTKRKIGTGLGLYLSKQIIDAHYGRIWFETKEEVGTTFYFALPVT